MTDYVSHLRADDHQGTACGERWQGWQAPERWQSAGNEPLPPHEFPTPTGPGHGRPAVPVRFCGACQRVAMETS